jgi:hypothetical protein
MHYLVSPDEGKKLNKNEKSVRFYLSSTAMIIDA